MAGDYGEPLFIDEAGELQGRPGFEYDPAEWTVEDVRRRQHERAMACINAFAGVEAPHAYLTALRAVAEAARDFARVANIVDALPEDRQIPDDAEPSQFAPKAWPLLGTYRKLRDELAALNALAAREAGG